MRQREIDRIVKRAGHLLNSGRKDEALKMMADLEHRIKKEAYAERHIERKRNSRLV